MHLLCLSLHIPSTAAGTDDEWYVAVPAPGTHRLKAVKFAPATAVAQDGTNYRTVTITKNDGAAGSDSSAICSFDTNTGTGSHVAFALRTTLSPTLTQQGDFTEGQQLKVAATHTGTGAVLDGTFTFLFEKIN